MRKITNILISFIVIVALSVSCDLLPVEKTFDETLLIGKWQSETLFYKYLADGSGTTWDTSDDVTEEEAQEFTWTLVASELTHIHVLALGGTVPKVYTLTELTDSTLIYNDDFGKVFSFEKVTN